MQPHVLLLEGDLDLLAQDLRVEQVLQADAEARGLVRVRRADPAPGRPDLQLAEPSLARLVDRQVPRHDHVRVPGQADRLRRDAAMLEVVQLVDEDARIDDAARPDHAFLSPEDP